jgi:REP element-mobilizing transposase RayT
MRFYRRNLPHIEKFSAAYFVTFRTKGSLFLPPAARSIAFKHCLYEHEKRAEMFAFVIMPNHVHLLFTALPDDNGEPFPLAQIMKGIKGSSAYGINKLLGRRGALWQDESFDHVMRSGTFQNKFNYILANPIDAGLAARPDQYQWLWTQPSQGHISVLRQSG